MVFSDTTSKSGLIQEAEFWTGLGDAGISGDPTLLKQFTSRINRAFERIMPLLLSYGDKMRFDDPNHTDYPIGFFDIVSGVGDYTFPTDENGNSILNVTDLLILDGPTQTEYRKLDRMTLDDPDAQFAMTPNPTHVGIPTKFLEYNGTVFLFPKPNYNATAGGKLFFERQHSYFIDTDTTKAPGIPLPFHQLLALHASLDWLSVYKPDKTAALSKISGEIQRQERSIEASISNRNPLRRRAVGARARSI